MYSVFPAFHVLTKSQIVNMAAPITIILLFVIYYSYLKKTKPPPKKAAALFKDRLTSYDLRNSTESHIRNAHPSKMRILKDANTITHASTSSETPSVLFSMSYSLLCVVKTPRNV